MITQISIGDFVICQNANIMLDKGFTALTGETGAGKSIILDALALALGERANYNKIMNGKDQATITVAFDVVNYPKVISWLEFNGFSHDGNIIIKRILKSNKKSRSLINGEPISTTQLKELSNQLVSIYAQHSHHQLTKKESGLSVLDSCLSESSALAATKSSYKEYMLTIKSLQEAKDRLEAMKVQQELNRFYLNELEELNPDDDEYDNLKESFTKHSNKEKILSDISSAASVLENEDFSVASAITEAQKKLNHLLGTDQVIDDVYGMLEEASINVQESVSNLSALSNNYEMDDFDINEAGSRIAKFESIAKKHDVNPNDLLSVKTRLERDVNGFDEVEQEIIELKEKSEQKFEAFKEHGLVLHSERLKAAELIEAKMQEMMPGLGLETAQISFELKMTDTAKSSGLTSCEILFSANKGTEKQPLSQAISGGELSRVSLCLQVAISERSSLPTLIFDEVDVGIGGKSADSVGAMLKQLGVNAQVISITHQPSVASYSDHHLVVSKDNTQDTVSNKIVMLSDEEKIKEIARMLNGDENSQESIGLAKSMISRS